MAIIDARLSVSGKNGRPYSIKAAISDALIDLPPGGSATFDAFYDAEGRPVSVAVIRAGISQAMGSGHFTTRKLEDGGLRVFRNKRED